MNRKHVLVTGASGHIGWSVCRELIACGHTVRGFDLVLPKQPIDGLTDMRLGNLTDPQAVRDAVAGVDTIVHLAASTNQNDFLEVLLPSNVIGIYQLLEAARLEKVQRVVVTSSVQVVQGLDTMSRTITVDEPPSPWTHYAVTKVMAEAWARYYADQHGMSMIVVRPAWSPPPDWKPPAETSDDTSAAIFLSPNDAGRFFTLCVEAVDILFATLFATSRPKNHMAFDLEPAKRLIGYEPQDQLP